ncbi:MAG: hypothetical protein IK093_12070 [Ruminiclostridium sp.]|nr:hypothetical protein [Ruminiclostridium sp.]
MKEKIIYNLKMVIILSGAVLFIAVMVWFLVGLERTRVSTDDQRLRNVRQSVVNGAVLCYSVEGVYPESLDYLKENYGLEYDENRYLVHYKYVSADIRPSIMVYDNDKPTE